MNPDNRTPDDDFGQGLQSLRRRQFLRGIGACLSLPLLESLTLRGFGASKESKFVPPARAAFLCFPNGAIPSAWWPKQIGDSFEFSRTLAPLEPFRDHIQILGGLDQKHAYGGPDGAGDHARGNGVFLTGVRLKKSATDIRGGVSIDQIIAKQIGHLTRFQSLEFGADSIRTSGACDSGYACAYQYNLSWSTPTTPLAAESNPRVIFEKLFGAGNHGERALNLRRRREEQRSLLDFVIEDAKAMNRRLNGKDREKLDQYLTGIRQVELSIQKAEKFGQIQDPDLPTPVGIPQERSQYVQLMFDMLVLAFQTDSTRVATFLLGHDGDNRSLPEIGVSEGHHDLSHHFNNEDKVQKLKDIDLWYSGQFAKLLEKLEAAKDPDGRSILERSMILYGSGNADGNRHTHSNLPLVLAGGKALGLRTGRYISHGSKPMNNLLLEIARRSGASQVAEFGDSTGLLSDV